MAAVLNHRFLLDKFKRAACLLCAAYISSDSALARLYGEKSALYATVGIMPIYDDEERTWTWRNTRDLYLCVTVVCFPWGWRFAAHTTSHYDVYVLNVQCLFLVFSLEASIGNISSESRWRAWFGLSENTAWERSKNARKK